MIAYEDLGAEALRRLYVEEMPLGPTTSGRMDAYAPTMMSVGARGMIGKGARLPEVVEAMKKYSGVYFGAIGGAGALLAKCIKKAELSASAPRSS